MLKPAAATGEPVLHGVLQHLGERHRQRRGHLGGQHPERAGAARGDRRRLAVGADVHHHRQQPVGDLVEGHDLVGRVRQRLVDDRDRPDPPHGLDERRLRRR